MLKRFFLLAIVIFTMFFLIACVEPPTYVNFLESEDESYAIQIKVMQKAGLIPVMDKYYKLQFGFVSSDFYYNELFESLGILERDFYCFPGFESFAKNTVLDLDFYTHSFNKNGEPSKPGLSLLLHVPTLHGDRITSFESQNFRHGKFKYQSYIINAPFDQYLDEESGLILEPVDSNIIKTTLDTHFSLNPDSKIEVFEVLEYLGGFLQILNGLFWPTGVDYPTAGPHCSVAKIVEHEDNYSIFQSLIQNSTNLETLNSETDYTIFAPQNTVFEDIFVAPTPAFTRIDITEDQDAFLNFHAVEGRYSHADLIRLAPFQLQSLHGQKLNVISDGTRVFINGHLISEKDMLGTNGYVHGIDGTLYKQTLDEQVSIFDIVAESDDLTTLQSIITLLAENDILLDEDTYTLFAPLDEGFDAWLTSQGVDMEDDPNLDLLLDIVMSHLILGAYNKNQLKSMTSTASFTFDSLLEGAPVTISQDNEGSLYANDVLIVEYNLLADDGLIHKVESSIIPVELVSVFETMSTLENLSRFDTLLDIMAQNGIFLGEGPNTIFAPSNDAILDWLVDQNIDIYSESELDNVVSFVYAHITEGLYSKAQLTLLTLEDSIELETLLSDVSITISQDEEGKLYANDVLIVESLTGSDGVIHIVNEAIAPEKTNTLMDVLVSLQEFTIFLQLLEETGLDVLLKQAQPVHTVIAPTNQAFEALMVELQIDLDTLRTLDILESILKYHFIPGVVTMDDLTALYNQSSTSINTLLPQRSLTISLDEEAGVALDGISLHWIHGPADNGYLLLVETILIPEPYEDEPALGHLIQVLEEGQVFDIFIQALEATGLDLMLSGTTPYTLFAPLDGLFTVLMMQREITLEQLLADEDLADFLKSHIVAGIWTADDLKALLANGVNEILTLNNTVLTITQEGDYLYINGQSIIVPNTMAMNGVMHSMGGFLVDAT